MRLNITFNDLLAEDTLEQTALYPDSSAQVTDDALTIGGMHAVRSDFAKTSFAGFWVGVLISDTRYVEFNVQTHPGEVALVEPAALAIIDSFTLQTNE